MATSFPAQEVKFGDTEYYLVTMKVSDFLKSTLPAQKASVDWDNLEERYQRDLNYSRIKNQIYPYLIENKDRFFGAFVLLYDDLGDGKIWYEPIFKTPETEKQIGEILPVSWTSMISKMGILSTEGGTFIPIDGQHRMEALRYAFFGVETETGKSLKLGSNPNIGNEDISVIIIKNKEQGRLIFNKINKYAKATSTADNILTDDDNYLSKITLGIVTKYELKDIVKINTSSLSASDTEFITLSTIQEINRSIITNYDKKPNEKIHPSIEVVDEHTRICEEYWDLLMEIDLFKKATEDKSEAGNISRIELRKEYILLKPLMQQYIAIILFKLRSPGGEYEAISKSECLKRINGVDWGIDNPIWYPFIIQSGTIMTENKGKVLTYLNYLFGVNSFTNNDLENLSAMYKTQLADSEAKLPKRLYEQSQQSLSLDD